MSAPTSSSVADLLVAQAGSPPQPVKQRIERRISVLRGWLRDGIPAGKAVPSSLTAAREWDDEELGIQRISSPNEFTTTHPQHSQLVRDVAGLLTELKKRYQQPASKSTRRKADPADKFDQRAHDRDLKEAVSQWHAERDRHLWQKERADSAEARSVALLEENAQMEKLIADLRRQLAKHKGLKAVE
jgi:hypothetical protein